MLRVGRIRSGRGGSEGEGRVRRLKGRMGKRWHGERETKRESANRMKE